MINPYVAMLLIGLMLAGLMLGLRTLQHRFDLHPEVARKLMHVAMGLVTLTLPWLFHSHWPSDQFGRYSSHGVIHSQTFKTQRPHRSGIARRGSQIARGYCLSFGGRYGFCIVSRAMPFYIVCLS